MNRFLYRFFTVAVLSFALLQVSCASKNDKEAGQPSEVVEILYNQAADALSAKQYKKASDAFGEVERQYPYSKWATQAQLMAAYSSYKDLRYDEAVLTLDRFIELHPGHKSIDYAYYLRAMCFYERISDVKRDQEITVEALKAFEALIRRFPDSNYAKDSLYKRDLTLDNIAGKEMLIGRYYLRKGHYNAAINRFKTVIDKYQTTTHTPEALHRMVEAYLSLGIDDQAMRVAAVLGYNFPGSEWYEKSYNLLDPSERERLRDERSWFKRTVESLLDRGGDNKSISDSGTTLPAVILDDMAPEEDNQDLKEDDGESYSIDDMIIEPVQ